MTSIERTAYPRFSRAPSVKELRELYTPTPHDIAFVTTGARGDGPQFALMILLKAFQRLGYFPSPQEIPGAVISHIRAVMRFPDGLVPDIVPRTMYRYHAAIRVYLDIKSDGQYIRDVAAQAIYTAVQIMDTPADLINVAIETLVKEHCELPAFTTPEDQEKRIKYNDLIANCVILNNTVELSEKLNELAQEGYAITKDELAALSPY